MVPPPKYNVDRLIPCRTGASTRVGDLFLIERGAERLSEVSPAQAVEELMVNTADAYGFPPFQYLAPALVLGDGDYAALQRRERAVLASAIARIRIRAIASDSFTWADTIPALLEADRCTRPTVSDGRMQEYRQPRSQVFPESRKRPADGRWTTDRSGLRGLAGNPGDVAGYDSELKNGSRFGPQDRDRAPRK